MIQPAPSWGTVLATTLRLWLQRRSAWARRLIAAAAAVAVFGGVALIVMLGRHLAATPPGTGRQQGSGSAPSLAGLAAAAAARHQAATWVAAQVSGGSIVACDPVMCSALQAQGVPAASLLVLGPSAGDPLGSAVVVSTAAIRSQFGARLASVYAPTVLAAFGSGTARVEVRVIAPDGSAAYLSLLNSDLHARMALGAQLLRNSHVSVTETAARQELAAGQADARLLITFATLAGLHDVRIVSFGDGAAGSSYGVPLRAAELASPQLPRGAPGGELGYLKFALDFMRAQRAPFLAAHADLLRINGGQLILRIEFAAPSPLGLLDNQHAAR